LMVQGLGLRVQDLGLGVWNVGSRAENSPRKVGAPPLASDVKVWGVGIWVLGFGVLGGI